MATSDSITVLPGRVHHDTSLTDLLTSDLHGRVTVPSAESVLEETTVDPDAPKWRRGFRLQEGWEIGAAIAAIAAIAGWPIWWALGLNQFVFITLGAILGRRLLRRGRIRVPDGFWLWALFFLVVVISAFKLNVEASNTVTSQGIGRYFAFTLRTLNYVSVAVLLLYVGNTTERELERRRIIGYMSILGVTSVSLGTIAIVLPNAGFPTAMSFVLPNSVLGENGGMAKLAQVQPILGDATPRPSAPFAFTNYWGNNVSLLLVIGPPRANRKPVIQVTDRRGDGLCYSKVSHNELTERLVNHEYAVLKKLKSVSPSGFRSPKAQALLRWDELTLLVLEPLDLPSQRLTGPAAREEHVSVIRSIARLEGVTQTVWARHPLKQGLLNGLPASGRKAEQLAVHLSCLPGEAQVQVASWHGDLNSGNVALLAEGSLVWDWERFTFGVPLGFDLLHHDLHFEITSKGQSPRVVAADLLASAAERMKPLGITPEVADLTACAYLLTLAQRYIHDRQADHGSSLGRVEDWILPALDDHMQGRLRSR